MLTVTDKRKYLFDWYGQRKNDLVRYHFRTKHMTNFERQDYA